MVFRSAKALDRAQTHATFRQAMQSYEKTAESWFDGSVDSVDRRLAHVDKLLHHIRTVIARLSFADSVSQLRAGQTLSADRASLVDLKRTLLTGAADYSTWDREAAWNTDHGDHALGFYDNQPGNAGFPMDKVNPYNGKPKKTPQYHEVPEESTVTPGGNPYTPSEPRWKKPKRITEPGGRHRAEAALEALPPADRRWVTLEAARFVSANTDCLSDPEELATRAQHHGALKTSTFSPQHSHAVTQAFVGAVTDLGTRSYRPPAVKTAAAQDDSPPETMFL